jgi:hypothetical protein
MGVHEGSGDSNSDDFEKTYLIPLERDLRSATNAMDHMSQVLAQARRDCQ